MECYYSLVSAEGCFRKKLNVFFYVVEVEIMTIIKPPPSEPSNLQDDESRANRFLNLT